MLPWVTLDGIGPGNVPRCRGHFVLEPVADSVFLGLGLVSCLEFCDPGQSISTIDFKPQPGLFSCVIYETAVMR